MPEETNKLKLIKPLENELYDIDVHNTNSDILDQFAQEIDNDIGNRTYTEQNVVTNGESITKSIDELDVDIGNRTYTEQNVVTNGESITKSIDELDVDIGNRTYTEQNVVTNGESITKSIDELDVVAGLIGLGGVVESGSNANGRYIKFADGTLIFHTLRTLPTFGQGGQINFPTPEPFISVTNGFVAIATTGSYRMNYYEAGSSTSSISFLVSQLGSSSPAPTGTSVKAVVFAIGRWK